VLGFGIAAAVYSALRPASDPARHNGRGPALIALVWFLLPVLLMTYVGQAVHPFYLLLSLPAGHVLAAWGLGVIFQPERRPGGPILALLGIPLAVLMGLNSARYAQETAALPGAHGLTALSLEYGLPLGRAVRETLPPEGVVQVGVEGWIVQRLVGQTFPVLAETRAPRFTLIPREGGVLVDAYAPDEALPAVAGAELALRLGLPDGWTLAVEAFPAGAARAAPWRPDSRSSGAGRLGLHLRPGDRTARRRAGRRGWRMGADHDLGGNRASRRDRDPALRPVRPRLRLRWRARPDRRR
jgi:hypothetical protein